MTKKEIKGELALATESDLKKWGDDLRQRLETYIRAPHRHNRYKVEEKMTMYGVEWVDFWAYRPVKKRKKK